VVHTDPLNSPHPVPWSWITATFAEQQSLSQQKSRGAAPQVAHYRSATLMSPDGVYAAYSRLQFTIGEALYLSQVQSILLLENLETGNLQAIQAASPLGGRMWDPDRSSDLPGAIGILMPLAWSADSQQLLCREFEGVFCSSEATDYGVVWDRNTNMSHTLTPIGVSYDYAVLLGWSEEDPASLLFKTGTMGDRQCEQWRVGIDGRTVNGEFDEGQVFGQTVSSVWNGPQ
jgi:hypothetical protein